MKISVKTGTLAVSLAMLLCPACSGHIGGDVPGPDAVFTVDISDFVSRGYVGNGVQWDPYERNYGDGTVEISGEDWEKLYSRLDFMRPSFVRVMCGTAGIEGNTDLRHILDWCQSRGVTVMFGDWGGSMIDRALSRPSASTLKAAASALGSLIREEGYDCIRYYNLVNEPNGSWSSTGGDKALWLRTASLFCADLEDAGLKPSLAAPDIAIWTDRETDWIVSTRDALGDAVGIYDIHTYPSKVTVNSGEYSSIISAYRSQVPGGKKAIMGELGFKYIEQPDMDWEARNRVMIEACPHASRQDSQMMVFDHMYGTDMADAVFQTMNCGYSGCIAWMLDDAMHNCEAPGKLKIWGFWNIFGDEIFGSEHEAVRPWYYAWSLLCRYIPAGCDVCRVSREGDGALKAVAIVKDGRRTLAFVNVGGEDRTARLDAPGMKGLKGAARFVYSRDGLRTEGDHTLLPVQENVSLSSGDTVNVPAESLVVITEIL